MGWRFLIDRGGTFTDFLAYDKKGQLHTLKVLSRSSHYNDAISHGIRQLMRIPSQAKINIDDIETIRLGTTITTNAFLERKGAKVLFITTSGFKNALEIGFQNRIDIFATKVEKPQLLYASAIEVNERIDAQGRVIESLDIEQFIKMG